MKSKFMRGVGLRILVVLGAVTATVGPLSNAHPVGAAVTFVVNAVGDAGDRNRNDGNCDVDPRTGAQCTLRAAIEQANAVLGPTTIAFDIAGPGVHTIRPRSPLPDIVRHLSIDGYSQPGARPSTATFGTNAALRIELDGSQAPRFAFGFRIPISGVVVRGLVINRFARGIYVESRATDVRIEGCFIGTNAAGTAAKGNEDGIYIYLADRAVVGGATLAARNLIAGYTNWGLVIGGTAKGTKVQGNLIGTDASGTGDLGNGDDGMTVSGANTLIGGDAAAANTVAFNRRAGVRIFSGSVNRITGNAIFGNGELGIELGERGRDPIDPGDLDTGSNGLQNAPEVTSVVSDGETTTIPGRLRSTANHDVTIEVFSTPADEEAEFFRGRVSVRTDADGVAPFVLRTAALPAIHNVTATATSATGNTSELSAPAAVA